MNNANPKLNNAIISLEGKAISAKNEIAYIESELNSGESINGFTLPGMLDIAVVSEVTLPFLRGELESYELALEILRAN
jgi:hypothetical protein